MVFSKAALVLLRIIVSGTMLSATALAEPAPTTASAILAGGCFWCVEHDMRQLPGITEAVSGYTGGSRPNPTYEDYHDVDAVNPVPHVEAVRVTYDPAVLSYEKLLDYYFRHIDPTDGGGQFCDRGPAYRPAVFVGNEAERKVAEAKKAEVARLLKQKVAVDVLNGQTFWPAEDYHQDYASKNPIRYKYYRWNCGRDQRVEEVWKSAQL
jgi:peptide-methionine (S)-S-oxide reductase